MKIGRLDIGFWEYKKGDKKQFITFEYLRGSCKCKFVTILNILFHWTDKDCK